jgi:histone H3/H4
VLVLPAATSSPFEKAQAQAMVQAAAQAQAVVAAAKNRGGGLVPMTAAQIAALSQIQAQAIVNARPQTALLGASGASSTAGGSGNGSGEGKPTNQQLQNQIQLQAQALVHAHTQAQIAAGIYKGEAPAPAAASGATATAATSAAAAVKRKAESPIKLPVKKPVLPQQQQPVSKPITVPPKTGITIGLQSKTTIPPQTSAQTIIPPHTTSTVSNPIKRPIATTTHHPVTTVVPKKPAQYPVIPKQPAPNNTPQQHQSKPSSTSSIYPNTSTSIPPSYDADGHLEGTKVLDTKSPEFLSKLNADLTTFWTQQLSQMHELGNSTPLNEQDFKNHNDLPLARIKRIMKSDEDVRMISAEAPVLFAKACEMFILEMTLRSGHYSENRRRKTLTKEDCVEAIGETDIYDFLVDVIH